MGVGMEEDGDGAAESPGLSCESKKSDHSKQEAGDSSNEPGPSQAQ